MVTGDSPVSDGVGAAGAAGRGPIVSEGVTSVTSSPESSLTSPDVSNDSATVLVRDGVPVSVLISEESALVLSDVSAPPELRTTVFGPEPCED